jgi:exodeoxyribonuclease VII large subunit
MHHCAQRLFGAFARRMNEWRLTVQGLARGLPDPQRLLQERSQQLDQWAERWTNARQPLFHRRRDLIANLGARLKTPGEQIAAAGAALQLESSHLRSALRHTLERQDRLLERTAAGLSRRGLEQYLDRKAHALDALGRLLESYSYDQVLKRGFALVRNAAGQPVLSAEGIGPAQRLRLQFHDGEMPVVTEGRARPVRRPGPGNGDQGSLL